MKIRNPSYCHRQPAAYSPPRNTSTPSPNSPPKSVLNGLTCSSVVLLLSNMAFSLSLVDCVACLFSSSLVRAGVTVYGLQGQTVIQLNSQSTTTTAVPTTSYLTDHGPPQFTGPAAYNQIFLAPPAPPDPAPATTFAINVPQDASLLQGLSIMVNGTFFGFSIEMSVADQLSALFRLELRPIFGADGRV